MKNIFRFCALTVALLVAVNAKADFAQDVRWSDCETYRNINLSTTGQIVKAAPATLCGWYIYSGRTSGTVWLKFYDKATAPTQADTPKMTIPLPTGPTGSNISWHLRPAFDAGLSVRCSTGVADNDTGAPSSNECVVNIFYK